MVEMRAFLCLDFRGLIIPLENVCVIQRFKGDGRCFPESDKTADGGATSARLRLFLCHFCDTHLIIISVTKM